MTERSLIIGAALLLVAMALLTMGGLHREHYKSRRYQMLEGRMDVVEKILRGDHD